MSKKSSSNSSSERAGWLALSRIFAFVALVLSIVIFLTLAILQWCNSTWGGIGWLSLIKDLALILAILMPAWYFVKPKKKVWHIIYWICVVIIVVFAVLGNQLGLF